MIDELARAHAALQRGACFLATRAKQIDIDPEGMTQITHAHRLKVIANGLRELDRFLNIMIDEVSLHYGLSAQPQQRNTANKLRNLRTALRLPHPDQERLLALGRSRDCLLYCGGVAMRSDTPMAVTMTLGWPGKEGTLRRVPVGRPIAVARADIESVCDFYRAMADDLVLPITASHSG